jgi:hypothetical protein
MSQLIELFPDIDPVTEYYLMETISCLQHYLHMDENQAFQTIASAKQFKELVAKSPYDIQRETGYYWAMYLVYGPTWWKNQSLVEQHVEYIKTRHDPPVDK